MTNRGSSGSGDGQFHAPFDAAVDSSADGADSAAAGATITLKATLETVSVRVLSGKTVTFTINAVTLSAKTNASRRLRADEGFGGRRRVRDGCFAGDTVYVASSSNAILTVG